MRIAASTCILGLAMLATQPFQSNTARELFFFFCASFFSSRFVRVARVICIFFPAAPPFSPPLFFCRVIVKPPRVISAAGFPLFFRFSRETEANARNYFRLPANFQVESDNNVQLRASALLDAVW